MSLLTDAMLSQHYAEQIRAANESTQQTLCSLCDAYLPLVNFYQLADCFSAQARSAFQARTVFTLESGEEEVARCSLVFLLDDFFARSPPSLPDALSGSAAAASASPAAPPALYIFHPRTRALTKSTFHAERTTITKDEEAALLQLLQEPGTQFNLFQKALRTSFPSIRISSSIRRDIPRFLDGASFAYYGSPRDGTAPFWYLQIDLVYPIFTHALERSLREHALCVRTAEASTREEEEVDDE